MILSDAAGARTDGVREADASQRDRMREMIERRGGKLPTPLRQPGLINETVDLDAVARDEQNEMQGYHGLDIDDASGMKMFYTGNTLSELKRTQKQRQFRIVHFYVELARRSEAVGADVETRELSDRQAVVAHMIYNSSWYTAWLFLIYGINMMLSFWEPAFFGQKTTDIPPSSARNWLVPMLECGCISAYGLDGLMQVYVSGWRDFYSRGINKVFVCAVAVMVANLYGGPLISRYARPLLVFVRHARIRSECGMTFVAASKSMGPFFLLIAIICLGAIFSVILLREEYAGEVIPHKGSGVASAASVGSFSNIHRSVLTLLALLVTSDHYQFVYLARDYPEVALGRQLAAVFVVLLSAILVVTAANAAWALFAAYQREVERAEQMQLSRQRRFLALSFKTLDDRKKSYISIEKLRYMLATIYPSVPFEPIASKLKHNVEQQSGLVDFFDYLMVMDSVLNYEAADPMLLYHTHLWHTLPLFCVIVNAIVLALFGSISSDATVDSLNAFFTFLYGVEMGAKMFALRPTRFFRSYTNRIDAGLVMASIVAVIMTIIHIFEAKSFWRCWASLPLLRVCILSRSLRNAFEDSGNAAMAASPGFAAFVLLAYIFAIGGMQLFHGSLATESGYPGQLLTFDHFADALLLLMQVTSGGWSRTLLGPANGAGPHGERVWTVGTSQYGAMEGMEDWKEGPTILGGPLRAGQVDAAMSRGSRAASWYLLIFRFVAVSLLATTFLRALTAAALSRARRRQHTEAVEAAGGGTTKVQGRPIAAVAADGLPALQPGERDHVADMLAGVQRIQAEMLILSQSS